MRLMPVSRPCRQGQTCRLGTKYAHSESKINGAATAQRQACMQLKEPGMWGGKEGGAQVGAPVCRQNTGPRGWGYCCG